MQSGTDQPGRHDTRRLVERASRRVACLRVLVLAGVALAISTALEAAAQLPCGVDAVVGMTRILGKTVQEATIEEISADYSPPNTMSLLDVARELQIIGGTKPDVVEASFQELLWLDRPHVIHTSEGGCSECPEGGHVVAVERLAGEWAIIVQADGTQLTSAEQLRSSYGGHAVLFLWDAYSGPRGPRLAFDSYVLDTGNITAGEARYCRLAVRNAGSATLEISRIEAGDSLSCSHTPSELGPAHVDYLDLTILPSHRLDRAFDTRTFFAHVHSNDPVRPRTTVALRCTVVEPVIVKSPVVYFPRVSATTPGERTIPLECRHPVKLLGAVPSDSAVAVAIDETGETLSGTHYQLRLSVDVETLQPGVVEIPIALQLEGVSSEGAELIARVRVWSD